MKVARCRKGMFFYRNNYRKSITGLQVCLGVMLVLICLITYLLMTARTVAFYATSRVGGITGIQGFLNQSSAENQAKTLFVKKWNKSDQQQAKRAPEGVL